MKSRAGHKFGGLVDGGNTILAILMGVLDVA
jgi:hypothetical protein